MAKVNGSKLALVNGTDRSLRLAAIDVGSNSVHMIIAQVDPDGGITTLWRMKEMVGLGRGSFPSHRLSDQAMDRAIAVLDRFKQAAIQRQAEKIVAVATSAIREASNGGDFIQRAKRELGLYIKVVSAREEARLIYLAIRHALPLKNKPHLMVDVGGGSVEFIVGDDHRAVLLESRKLGAARMTAEFVKTDPISPADLQALLNHYDQQLSPLIEQIQKHKPVACIGSSGTLENIAAMCGTGGDPQSEGSAGYIDREAIERLYEQIIKSDSRSRARFRGLDYQRRDQIVAGVVLVHELFKRLKIKRMQLCGSALREGILLDYLNRHIPEINIRRDIPDPRRRSVFDLARKCNWHKSHSEHVATLTLKLFDELKSLHGLGQMERELIEYGALLHDIGWHIGPKGHHKHSAYLILNGDLRNFTDEEVQIIANIARYHRKAVPTRKHESYASLSSRARRIVDVGTALLRLADGLDRSHGGVVQDVHCRVTNGRVNCRLYARSDAALELWGARRKREWFKTVFGRAIEFELKQSS